MFARPDGNQCVDGPREPQPSEAIAIQDCVAFVASRPDDDEPFTPTQISRERQSLQNVEGGYSESFWTDGESGRPMQADGCALSRIRHMAMRNHTDRAGALSPQHVVFAAMGRPIVRRIVFERHPEGPGWHSVSKPCLNLFGAPVSGARVVRTHCPRSSKIRARIEALRPGHPDAFRKDMSPPD